MGEWWVFLIYVVFGFGIIAIFQAAYNLVLAPVRFDIEQRSEITELKKKTEHPKLKIFYDETIHRTHGPMGIGYGMQNTIVTRINIGVKCESLGVSTVTGVKVKIADIRDSSTPIQRHRHQFLAIRNAGAVVPIEHEMTLNSGETGEFQLVSFFEKPRQALVIHSTSIDNISTPRWATLNDGFYKVELQAIGIGAETDSVHFEFNCALGPLKFTQVGGKYDQEINA